MKRLQAIVLLVLFLFSCKKQENKEQVTVSYPNTALYIANKINVAVSYSVYTSLHDYKHSANSVVSIILKPDEVYKWTPDYSKIYYVDWYTIDKKYTNWGAIADQPGVILGNDSSYFGLYDNYLQLTTIGMEYHNHSGDTMLITNNPLHVFANIFEDNDMRHYLINDNDPETHWHAADIQNRLYQSVWQQLPASSHDLHLVLSKDMRYSVTMYDSIKGVVADSGNAFFEGEPRYDLYLYSDLGAAVINYETKIYTSPLYMPRYKNDTLRLYNMGFNTIFVRDK